MLINILSAILWVFVTPFHEPRHVLTWRAQGCTPAGGTGTETAAPTATQLPALRKDSQGHCSGRAPSAGAKPLLRQGLPLKSVTFLREQVVMEASAQAPHLTPPQNLQARLQPLLEKIT